MAPSKVLPTKNENGDQQKTKTGSEKSSSSGPETLSPASRSTDSTTVSHPSYTTQPHSPTAESLQELWLSVAAKDVQSHR